MAHTDLASNASANGMNTCVSPEGRFVFGLHRPSFYADNLRCRADIRPIGCFTDGSVLENRENFPEGPVNVKDGGIVFEIRNPFPFRGATYIKLEWADFSAQHIEKIRLPKPVPFSFSKWAETWFEGRAKDEKDRQQMFASLPEPVRIAVAVNSTDPADLVCLARLAARFSGDDDEPRGLVFEKGADGRPKPVIYDHVLFDAVANNPHLPDVFKRVMVLVPGVQGGSPVVGEWIDADSGSHVYEYLRQNSYIPWGHYAANMADDAVRYDASFLTLSDVSGMRHLYYQRSYFRLARMLGMPVKAGNGPLSSEELERLRVSVKTALFEKGPSRPPEFDRSLWGWNYGFDFSPSGYRLHASHQQVHQQFAMIPRALDDASREGGQLPSYACGDLVFDFICDYYDKTGVHFFDAYIKAVSSNRRMDGRTDRPSSLVVYEDDSVILFVPKAQTSQWELQLMAKPCVANILDADSAMRHAMDRGIFFAMQALSGLGARMVTVIEFSGRFVPENSGQRLLYSFLPRLPESPGSFSEAQLRWIVGHFPEDFAEACRRSLEHRLEKFPHKISIQA